MQITSYEEKAFRRAYNTHADFTSEKSAHLYTRVDRFVCNILDMMHSSNSSSLKWVGGGGVGCIFFWKKYVT